MSAALAVLTFCFWIEQKEKPMADDTVKQLVAEFTLDPKGWQTTIQKVREDLKQAASDEASRASVASSASKAAIADLQTQAAQSKLVAAAASAATAQEQAKAAAIKTAATTQAAAAAAALDAITQQRAQTTAQAAQQAAASAAKRAALIDETDALRKKIVYEEMETKELQKQLVELRLKGAEQKEQSEGNLFTKGVTGIAGGLGGKGGAGFAGALIGGTAGAFAGEAAIEMISKLIEKVKEFVEDSGSLQKVSATFDSLAKGRGTNGEEFLNGLEKATHNLVPEVDLLRTANTFMQSGLKMSNADMLKLTAATVGLARAQGRDAGQAVTALGRAFLTGQARTLAMVTGIQRWQLQVKGLGPNVDQATKAQMQFAQVATTIEARYKQLGEPVLTYTDRLKQLQVVSNELFEDLAQGAVKSPGFQVLLDSLGKVIDEMGGMRPAVVKLGSMIGAAMSPVAVIFKDLISIVKTFASAFTTVAKTIQDDLGTPLNSAGLAAKDATASFAAMHPVLDIVAKSFAYIGGVIRQAAIDLKYFATMYDTFSKEENGVAGRMNANLTEAEGKAKKGDYKGALYSGFVKGAGFGIDPNKKPVGYSAATSQWEQETKVNQQQTTQDPKDFMKSLQDAENEIKKIMASVITPGKDTSLDRKQALELAKATSDAKIKAAQDSLATDKEIIAQEQEANEALYKSGTEEASKYYATKKNLAIQTFNDTKTEIDKEYDARKTELDKELALGQLTRPVYNQKVNALQDETQTKTTKATQTRDTSFAKTDAEQAQDQSDAQIALINAQMQQQKTAVAEQADAIKKAYAEELISGQDYLTQRLALIQQDLDFTLQAEQQKRAASKQTVAAQQAYLDAIGKKAAEVRKETAAVQEDAMNVTYSDVSKRYGNALQSNSALQNLAAVPGMATTDQQDQLKEQQKAILDAQIQSMTALANQATPYSETWNKIVDSIIKATQEQQLLNNEIAKSKDFGQNVAGLTGSLAQAGQGIFKGSFGTGFLASLGQGSKSLSDSFTSNQQLKTAFTHKGTQLDPATQALVTAASAVNDSMKTASQEAGSGLDNFNSQLTRTIDALSTFQQQLGKTPGDTSSNVPGAPTMMPSGIAYTPSTKDFDSMFTPDLNKDLGGGGGDGSSAVKGTTGGNIFQVLGQQVKGLISGDGSFKDLSKTLQTGVGAVGSFVSTITNAQSPLAGAFGGAQAGAGLGSALGGGPWGAVAGAAGGALMGILSGQKNQQIHQNIVDMEAAAQKISTSMSAGTTSLASGMQQMQALIDEATADAASSKKGNSQYEQLIKQYTQQLQALQAQATQTMQSMQEALDVLSAPSQYQEWVQNIESVLQQYSQFVGAAQNAQQLASANQFLSESLQNIGLQMGQQLQQDEETAVQNALALNDAYNQRNALNKQYLDQVHQIMSQGSLSRQTTSAQSKFSQLYDASAQYNIQLDQMNQQISLDQAQVAAAQQVFNLATTRQGLEQQLLTLQTAGINQDMQRISAMQNLLQLLSSTGYSLTGASANPNDPNSMINQLLAALLGGIPGAGTGNGALQTILQLLGQNGGFGGGGVLGGISAIGTPPSPVSALDTLSAQAYSSRASYGYGGYRGTNL